MVNPTVVGAVIWSIETFVTPSGTSPNSPYTTNANAVVPPEKRDAAPRNIKKTTVVKDFL